MLEQCRINGYYDISEIKYAIVEANGQLSILPKNRTVMVNDLNLNVEEEGLCANVIIDGKVMYNNLNNIGKTESWLKKELKKSNKNLCNVLLATVDINNKIVFYERNNDMKVLDVLE